MVITSFNININILSIICAATDSSYLVPDETVAAGTLLAARNGSVVEVVLLAHITSSTNKAGTALAPAVVSALRHPGSLGVAVAGCQKTLDDLD